jgi:aconitate hydratase
VIAESFERIHRSNLIGMGVLPLQFSPGESAASLGLTGRESYSLRGLGKGLKPGGRVVVRAEREDGSEVVFSAQARIDIAIELDYYHNGGILHTVLRGLLP